MRVRSLSVLVAVVLLPGVARAQAPGGGPTSPGEPAPAQAPAGRDEFALPTTFGRLDFGIRTTTVDGDAARYERYRDLSDGLFLETGRAYSERSGWVLDAFVDHLARRDQRIGGRAVKPGRFEVFGQWDQLPMLMSRTTQTLFIETSPGVLEIDDGLQAATQANPANLTEPAKNAPQFTLESQRHIFDAAATAMPVQGVSVDASFRHTDREGHIPYGGSFGHSQVVETIAPVNHTIRDFNTSTEYARGNVLVRGAFTGSWFKNDTTGLVFDNAFRLEDTTTAGGRGRTALPPSNSFTGVNGTLSYKLPYRSRITFYGSTSKLSDTDQPLLPFTINTALVSPQLDRPATGGEARTVSFNLTATTRPTDTLDFDLRVRTYDYENRTPEFTALQRVPYDNAVTPVVNTALQHTEPFGLGRLSFDADARYTPFRALSAGLGYGHYEEDRTHRIFENVSDDVIRLTVDSIGNRWVTLRTKFEHGTRRGHGDATEIGEELLAIGEQPGMRHYDVASRDRNRFTLMGMATPLPALSLTGSYATGKDDYIESEFGLRDNMHDVYSIGFDHVPSDYFGVGLSYSFERYDSLSRSRQANPGPQFTDPSRNWSTDSSDEAHSIIGHWEMREIRQVLTLGAFFDYNRATGQYHYITGPVEDRTLPEEVEVPTTLPPPDQLPDVKSNLLRFNVDGLYALSSQWDVGVSVWFEKYTVDDFSLDTEAISRLDPTGGLLIGYTYQPYTATTVWVRSVFKF